MANSLNPKILGALIDKLGINENGMRVRISEIRRKYPGITLNAAAQVIADSKGFSVMGRLDNEDRQSLRFINIAPHPVRLPMSPKKSQRKARPKIFINYQTGNSFQRKHIEEINSAYNAKCYTAVFILCRKVIENLIIDLLIKQFPEKKMENRKLYFDIDRGRFLDFSVVLENLKSNKRRFPPSVWKAIDRLVQKTKPFSKDANDKTHSWFHLATKLELDGIGIKEIIDLIIQIDSAIK